jgi:hypothetical protein
LSFKAFHAIRVSWADQDGEVVEQNRHHSRHEDSVEDVEGPFVGEQVPTTARGGLDDTEEISQHDETADTIENEEHRLPLDIGAVRCLGALFPNAGVEDVGDEDEQAEEKYL